jgi:DNA-directed RNA polymerase sigma subunit (sigma70/sigma32)
MSVMTSGPRRLRLQTDRYGESQLPAAVNAFLAKLGRQRLSRPEEERSLARRIECGDLVAKQLLIETNVRLVVSIAKHYARQAA